MRKLFQIFMYCTNTFVYITDQDGSPVGCPPGAPPLPPALKKQKTESCNVRKHVVNNRFVSNPFSLSYFHFQPSKTSIHKDMFPYLMGITFGLWRSMKKRACVTTQSSHPLICRSHWCYCTVLGLEWVSGLKTCPSLQKKEDVYTHWTCWVLVAVVDQSLAAMQKR